MISLYKYARLLLNEAILNSHSFDKKISSAVQVIFDLDADKITIVRSRKKENLPAHLNSSFSNEVNFLYKNIYVGLKILFIHYKFDVKTIQSTSNWNEMIKKASAIPSVETTEEILNSDQEKIRFTAGVFVYQNSKYDTSHDLQANSNQQLGTVTANNIKDLIEKCKALLDNFGGGDNDFEEPVPAPIKPSGRLVTV